MKKQAKILEYIKIGAMRTGKKEIKIIERPKEYAQKAVAFIDKKAFNDSKPEKIFWNTVLLAAAIWFFVVVAIHKL